MSQKPGSTVRDLQAQIAALTARLDEQAAALARLRAAPTTPARPSLASDGPKTRVGRRGLLTSMLGATAAAAALTVAKEAATAEANATGTISGSSTAAFGILATPGTGAPILPTLGNTTHGVIGSNSAVAVLPVGSGVAGARNGGGLSGVLGVNAGNGFGVYGASDDGVASFGVSTNAPGVQGQSVNSFGVVGSSSNSHGVFGDANNASGVFGRTANQHGVAGQATGGGNGLYGNATSGSGVYATATTGVGVFGTSSSNAGVAGSTANNNAVFGDASAAGNGVFARTVSGNGLVAQATGGGNAATFFGNVIVNGNFTVAPGFAKSGAVTFADGTMRRLYATEMPESWFEDVGIGRLVDGRASVSIDPDFVQAVNLGIEYHVFLTPHTEDIEALAVTVRAPDHFEVRANGKGQVTGTFSYRILAKRKAGTAPRFERVMGADMRAPLASDAALRLPTATEPPKLPPMPDLNPNNRGIPTGTAPSQPER